MPSKSKTQKTAGGVKASQDLVNTTRSGFGDNRAATEDAMMAAHAASLRATGAIDEEMTKQLSQPWHKTGELKIKYTKEYLAQHPDYTGKNADEMPTYETALRRQKVRDAAMKKFLADFKAGIIDEDGNLIERTQNSSSSLSSVPDSDTFDSDSEDRGSKTPTEQDDEASDSVAPPSSSSTPKRRSPEGTYQDERPVKRLKLNLSSPQEVPKLERVPFLGSLAQDPPTPNHLASSSQINSTSSSSPLSSSAPSSTPSKKRKRYRPTPKDLPAPLAPLPGHSSYQEFHYYELAALCRDRNLPSSGHTVVVRNRLVQDDIDIAQSRERAVRKQSSYRKKYKHKAPDVTKAEQEKISSGEIKEAESQGGEVEKEDNGKGVHGGEESKSAV